MKTPGRLVRHMNLFEKVEDPTDLALLKSVIASSERPEALVALGIRNLVISPTAALEVTAQVLELLADQNAQTRPRVLLLVDSTPIYRGTVNLKDAIATDLSERFEVETLVLGENGQLHADDEALDEATAALVGIAAVVSVGSRHRNAR